MAFATALPKRAGLHEIHTAMAKKKSPFVSFGDVAREQLGQQCQYASRYTGTSSSSWQEHGYPNLGQGLRFQGSSDDYHFLEIHKDDVTTFVQRYKEHRAKLGL